MDFALCQVAQEHHTGVYAIRFAGMNAVIDENNPFILFMETFKVEIPPGGISNKVQGKTGICGTNSLYMYLRKTFGELLVILDHLRVGSRFPAIGFFVSRSKVLRVAEQGKQGGKKQEYLFHHLNIMEKQKALPFGGRAVNIVTEAIKPELILS